MRFANPLVVIACRCLFQIMVEILKTVRGGGNVLIPTDSSGRVLELMRVLDQYWIQNKYGIVAHPLMSMDGF